jgi:hypothetical protein
MSIDPITSGSFSPFPSPGVAGVIPAVTGKSAPDGTQASGQMPDQTTLDAIKQALATLTAPDSTDGTDDSDSTDSSDPLAAILQSTQQDGSSSDATTPGSLGLDMMA